MTWPIWLRTTQTATYRNINALQDNELAWHLFIYWKHFAQASYTQNRPKNFRITSNALNTLMKYIFPRQDPTEEPALYNTRPCKTIQHSLICFIIFKISKEWPCHGKAHQAYWCNRFFPSIFFHHPSKWRICPLSILSEFPGNKQLNTISHVNMLKDHANQWLLNLRLHFRKIFVFHWIKLGSSKHEHICCRYFMDRLVV